MRRAIYTTVLCLCGIHAFAQNDSLPSFTQSPDTLPKYIIKYLEIKVAVLDETGNLPAIDGVRIYGGKKTAFVTPEKLNIDLSSNNSRQLFGRIPGIMVWESDGSGIQTGIATRGLSPNRSWEFNMRQNGYDISSDVFGYPEAYYTPPADAVKRIEVLRGASSLQYGPQFGGMINYVFDTAPATNGSETKIRQTFGSYGLFNNFISTGVRKDKFSFYSFYHRRSADGWRENSAYSTQTGFISLGYDFNKHVKLKAEYTHSTMMSQQPGGLTDAQFQQNAQQSFRARNWIHIPWNMMNVQLDIVSSEKFQLELKTFGLLATRGSVGFLDPITTVDNVLSSTNDYAVRRVDSDRYQNIGTELRGKYVFKLFGNEQTLAFGARAYQAKTFRRQKGNGTTGFDYNMELDSLGYKVNYVFGTKNYALFAEQALYVGKRLLFVPGVRLEQITASGSGTLNYNSGAIPLQERTVSKVLAGVGAEFHLNEKNEIYANVSQAFRPMTFSEVVPSATTDVIDPNLKDSESLNIDLGVRGSWKNYVSYDVSVYQMNIQDRIGAYTEPTSSIRYVTNIGSSLSKGVEMYVEGNLIQTNHSGRIISVHPFASIAYSEAVYTSWNDPTIAAGSSSDRTNNMVENAPRRIQRYGLTCKLNRFTATYQLNKVSDAFADALNTVTPNAAATTGLIPAYQVSDLSFAYNGKEKYTLQMGVNNLFNESYFTRRAGGYPGPGLLPANGRTYFFTFGIQI
jgi:Fe(3+) dicitrate transport protein